MTKEEAGPFSAAVFEEKACEGEAKLLAGQHQIAAVQKPLTVQLDWYEGLKSGRKENEEVSGEEKEAHELLMKNGVWLAKVYNLCE